MAYFASFHLRQSIVTLRECSDDVYRLCSCLAVAIRIRKIANKPTDNTEYIGILSENNNQHHQDDSKCSHFWVCFVIQVA